MEKLISNTNLREKVYDVLKNMIVLRKFEPGEKINEEQIAKQTGVSRTPIREALCRLENESIIKMIPRRGAFVIKQSEDTVREVLQVREVLEGLVTRLATRQMDEKSLSKLQKCLAKISSIPDAERNLMKYTQSDIQFHSILLAVCHNRLLQNMMVTVNTHLQIIRLRTVVLPGRAKKTVNEHFDILKEIEAGNAIKAETRMREHIESVRADAIINIDRMG
jgi:DNA-binding GntR family transcriptional regulator